MFESIFFYILNQTMYWREIDEIISSILLEMSDKWVK